MFGAGEQAGGALDGLREVSCRVGGFVIRRAGGLGRCCLMFFRASVLCLSHSATATFSLIMA
jgi:hypothetical protein